MHRDRLVMLMVLAAIIAGIGLIPATVLAGDFYDRRTGWDEWGHYTPPTASYPSVRYNGYVRTTYRSPDANERAGATYCRPCEKQALRVKTHRSERTKMVQKTTVTVNNYYPPKPKKVRPYRIVEPCREKLQGVKDELLATRNKLVESQERERVNSVERQKLAEENATWQERARNREAWIEYYRVKYIEHNGWR